MAVRPTVLIVDDDKEFLAFANELLSPLCAAVFVARTPLAAVWILESEPIDVVLCDLRLATSDGRHLLQSIRTCWPRVARVLVTGYPEDVMKEGTFPAAQAVVFKPVDGDSLADLIQRLGRFPAQRIKDVDLAEVARQRTSAQSIVRGGESDWNDDTDPGE